MINQTPRWLQEIKRDGELPLEIPLKDILTNSLYYPGSGNDSFPIDHFVGKIPSFIYVDYMPKGETALEAFKESKDPSHLFGNNFAEKYKLLGARTFALDEIVSNNWKPAIVDKLPNDYPRCFNSIPQKGNAIWCIMELNPPKHNPWHIDFDKTHNHEESQIFSFLYIFGEGVIMYDALYYGNQTAPTILALIQIFGFSGNWTNFANENDVMGQLVMKNNYGIPKYLMYGGWGRSKDDPGHYVKPIWDSYNQYIDDAEGGEGYNSPSKYATIWKESNKE